jgi:hypothetical protein
VLVVLPTIELLVQTLRAYRDTGDGTLGTVAAVCSDPSVAELELLHGEPDIIVTTTPAVLADSVRDEDCVTALSTYASLPVIAQSAQPPRSGGLVPGRHRRGTPDHRPGGWPVEDGPGARAPRSAACESCRLDRS